MGHFNDEIDDITLAKLNVMRVHWATWLFRANDWERGFIEDQLDRYKVYGPQMRCSAKQCSRIREIYEKVKD